MSQLPSDLKKLSIDIDGYIRPNLDTFSACSTDKLSFKHFTNLRSLTLNCLNNKNSYNVSIFPGGDSLIFASTSVLSGCFAQGLRSLDINLRPYGESLSYLLNHSISNLTTLVFLSIDINIQASGDLRNITFPHRLSYFAIKFHDSCESKNWRVLLDTLPIHLNYFALKLNFFKSQDIFVDDCKGESISSMKKESCYFTR
ncbi:unnamed protein product [Ambrosiozyma monospora]|uniref:Unnamed protein product n=1 Tax=Ambrosiozyma monospora TaxID=43982 RepID=A0ACB5U9J5_AMBMO|nr:unnamed protein product [Ambrosiozyma monospora]